MKRTIVTGIMLTLLASMLTLAFNIQSVKAATTIVAVYPPTCFALVGERFTVNVTITDVINLYAWQFNLTFNPSVLQVTGVVEGPFLRSVKSTYFLKHIDNSTGQVGVGASFGPPYPPHGADGNGTLASVTFQVTSFGVTPLVLEKTGTLLRTYIDGNLQAIEHETSDGYFGLIALVDVCPPASSALVGESFTVNITIADIADLYGWQFNLTFNPSILHVVDVAEGSFLRSVNSTIFVKHVDNSTGHLLASALFQPPYPPHGADGNGTLASVTFQVKSYGQTPLAFDEAFTYLRTVIDGNLQAIEHETSNGYFSSSPPPIAIEDVTITPATPNYDTEVTVSATITGDISEALLNYTCDSIRHTAQMNKSGDTYSATIPPQPYATLVQYKIYANDTEGNWVVSGPYSYTVIDDVKPNIVSSRYPAQPRANQGVKVSANLIEPVNASGVKTVLCFYRVNGWDPWFNKAMAFNATLGLYEIIIPGQKALDTVEYFVQAEDNAGNKNSTEIVGYTVALAGDANLDHIVDVVDAACISAHWYPGPPIGPLGYDPFYDLNGDGYINIVDSAIVNADWHKTW